MVTKLVNSQLEGVFALIGDAKKNEKSRVEAKEGAEET